MRQQPGITGTGAVIVCAAMNGGSASWGLFGLYLFFAFKDDPFPTTGSEALVMAVIGGLTGLIPGAYLASRAAAEAAVKQETQGWSFDPRDYTDMVGASLMGAIFMPALLMIVVAVIHLLL